jgi:hypothetical protein
MAAAAAAPLWASLGPDNFSLLILAYFISHSLIT